MILARLGFRAKPARAKNSQEEKMSKLKIYSILATAVALSYAAWASPVSIWPNKNGQTAVNLGSSKLKNCADTEYGQTCMPDEGPLMLSEYQACSSQAGIQILSQSRAFACMEAYLTVKLSFISGIEPNSYRQMPHEEQIEVNRRAFEAYRNWNPIVVSRSD